MKWSEMDERERDKLVAERVMGETVVTGETQYDHGVGHNEDITQVSSWVSELDGVLCGDPVPSYATDIAAAWQVLEQFIAAGCSGWVEGDGHTGYRAGVTTARWQDLAQKEGRPTKDVPVRFEADANTAPEAICLAALKAVGVEIEP